MRNILLAAGALVSATAIAGQGQSNPKNIIEDAIVDLGDQRQECIDLSGTWSGSCDVTIKSRGEAAQKQAMQQTATVKQTECGKIEVEGMPEVEIGAAVNESHSSELGFRTEQYAAYWEKNGKILRTMAEIQGMRYGEDEPFKQVEVSGKMKKAGAETVRLTKRIKVMSQAEQGKKDVTRIRYNCRLNLN